MSTLAAFLLAITGSVAARVLTSLGIGFATYAALSSLATVVVNNVISNYNAMGSVVLNLLNLAGAGQALGVLAAALVTRASLLAIKKLKFL